MEYHNNQLCISAQELTATGMSRANYEKMVARGRVAVAQRGGGYGKCALVVVDSLPEKYKRKVEELYPEGGSMRLHEYFRDSYRVDAEARSFFASYRLESGNYLPAAKITEYTTNASVIRAVQALIANANALRRAQGDSRIRWDDLAEAIAFFKQDVKHTLPESTLRFRKKVSQFNREGYECLVSGKFTNQNRRKVNDKIERLLLSLDSLDQRPFNSTTHENYMSFICGELDVYDPKTGELYDPDDYTDKNGEPIALSETTVANYLNKPINKALRSNLHDTRWTYNNIYRPHHHRLSPYYAFSKISMDDRDLPRKMPDGNRVKAYYAYDVASGAVIGYAYRRLKTKDLFIDCLRNMFQLIDRQGWNCPAEVEVEHHLVSDFKDDLMRAEVVFPRVTWCLPGNSQQKRAEHLNRAKKLGTEKLSQVGIGRWWTKMEALRPKVEKVYDEYNNTYKEATYSYEQLVVEDIRAIAEYNTQKHPNQKKYPEMTRWDVLCQNQNPDLRSTDKAILYRFIGDKTQTTLRRNMYFIVQGVKFALPSPEELRRLTPRSYTVEAYYVPDVNNEITEVYIYQGDTFIARCEPVPLYNEATVEQTEADVEAYREQAKYVSQFDAMIKREKIQKVKIMPKMKPVPAAEVMGTVGQLDAPAAPELSASDYDFSGYSNRAIDEL